MFKTLFANVKRNRTPISVWRHPLHFIAFGCGSGTSPIIPGTMGSLAAIPIYLLLIQCSLLWYTLIVIAAFALGCLLCERVSRDLRIHDHSGIVFDEWVGMWITLWMVPATWDWIAAAFILFRIFDVIKPWPIRWVDQQVTNGVGIMLDDVLAAVYANVILQVVHRWVI